MRTLASLWIGVAAASAACASQPAASPPTSAAAAGPSAPASAPATAPTAPPSPPASASAPATASDVVGASRAALDACYSQARAVDPKLGRTKVEMTFVVDEEGRPKTVDFKYRHRMDDRTKDCFRDAALALRFPASMQGTQTATIAFAPPGP